MFFTDGNRDGDDNYDSYKMYFTNGDRDGDNNFDGDNINNDMESFCIRH